VKLEFLEEAGVRLLVRREDLNHPFISGNKWWKLKYNLARALALGEDTLLTVGGAYSNHIFSVAAAAHALGLKSIGVIRGEETLPLNATLRFATGQGMNIHYVSRQAYREKSAPEFVERLRAQYGNFYFIPEGGTNELAVQGCRELGDQLIKEVDFDIVCLPVGTGGTLAGIIQALRHDQQAIGFSVLKNGGFLEDEVRKWLGAGVNASWRIETGFDFGGYAKDTRELRDFIRLQEETNQLPLDPIYTAKTLYGILELVRRGEVPRSTTVLMVHTGGLQGRRA
jgi:1-aminocyclopropane-1-carboxylate deaminase/D-cysteine desulfhydrase-like pyridoxal-dependent ACC family enzyme